MEWDLFLEPYRQAVEELKVKFKGIRRQFELEGTHPAIEFVTGRVKPIPSILEKAEKKGLGMDRLDELYDIAGIRIMCQFVEDIYTVVDLIRMRNDFEIVEEKDYISHKKRAVTVPIMSSFLIPSRRFTEKNGYWPKSKSAPLR